MGGGGGGFRGELISDFSIIPGAFARGTKRLGWLEAGSRASFTGSRPPPPRTLVLQLVFSDCPSKLTGT